MPTPGKDVIAALLAGDDAGALAILVDEHPDAFTEAMREAIKTGLLQQFATSSTSVTIGTGSKIFTLDASRGWVAGLSLVIRESTDPDNRYMSGTVSVDETTGVLTVNVTTAVGSGTFTSWLISLGLATVVTAAPTLPLASGGWGVDMTTNAETAKSGLSLSTIWLIKGLAEIEPSSPSTDDMWIVRGPTPWGGFDKSDLVVWKASEWVEITPEPRDFAFIETATFQRLWKFAPGSGTDDEILGWAEIPMNGRYSRLEVNSAVFVADFDVREFGNLDHFAVHNPTSPSEVFGTLPDLDAANGESYEGRVVTFQNIRLNGTSGGTLTVNVSGGGSISDGNSEVTSLSLTAGQTVRVMGTSSFDAGTETQWLVISKN